MNHGQFLKEVGLKIRTARKARKMPLTDLAKLCGTNLTQLSFIENGRCNWHILTIKSIAEVLQLDLKELF
jgi:transcriptional regulator with XRE-family HTH domain